MSMGGHAEPNALLVEGNGYLAAVYSIPDMQLLGRKALSLQVTRVLATPECLGSQRGKVGREARAAREYPRFPCLAFTFPVEFWCSSSYLLFCSIFSERHVTIHSTWYIGVQHFVFLSLQMRMTRHLSCALPPPKTKQVLYVVRSPRHPSGFLETMVYSDRGGLQCPEPLLPVGPQTQTAGSSGGWAGGRPYVNAHFVLRPWERVVDAKFQPLTTVTELATWGYKVRSLHGAFICVLCLIKSVLAPSTRLGDPVVLMHG